MKINDLLEVQKVLIQSNLNNVKYAIDATLGNGNDTNTIRKLYGADVKIYAFDIQSQAIESAKENIRKEYPENVVFINDTHEKIGEYVKETVQLIMINLG